MRWAMAAAQVPIVHGSVVNVQSRGIVFSMG